MAFWQARREASRDRVLGQTRRKRTDARVLLGLRDNLADETSMEIARTVKKRARR